MTSELDVLGLVSNRLSAAGMSFMLTGSFALAHYATPRMTRDLDIVVALDERQVEAQVAAFEVDFYIDADPARNAVLAERIFNLMHLESGVKVDLIVGKTAEFRQVECTPQTDRNCKRSVLDCQLRRPHPFEACVGTSIQF